MTDGDGGQGEDEENEETASPYENQENPAEVASPSVDFGSRLQRKRL